MNQKNILVIGSLNYDILLEQRRLPKKGETYVVDNVTIGPGGKGANQAVQCSKMGIKTVMIGALGNDLFGDYIIEQLQNFEIDINKIKRTNKNTGLGINNILPDGTLYANISRGANFTITKEDIKNLEKEFSNSKIVILQLEIPKAVTNFAIKLAEKHNCYIILNAAPAKSISEKVLSRVDCLVLNEEEATFYCDKKINNVKTALIHGKKLYSKIKDLLVITLGSKGSIIFTKKNIVHIPAINTKVVDTTGAGDTFIGVLSSQIYKNINYIKSVKLATMASSLTISKTGTQLIMPNKKDIEDIYKKTEINEIIY